MSKRVLLIKLTSMGDVIHTLPALTDAARAIKGITFDWVVDESFADIPRWHPAVDRVIKSAHRRWKKQIVHSVLSGQLQRFYHELNRGHYDVIVDTQNNLKSASIAWLRRGNCHGLDQCSVREKPAHWAYAYRHQIDKFEHAITRQRQIFAKALGYNMPDSQPDYGIDLNRLAVPQIALPQRYLFFVHNASWTTKLWPQQHWHRLIQKAQDAGFHVLLPCGNAQEQQRAQQLAHNYSHAIALPKLSLTHTAGIIHNAAGTVCCDTGLGHLASMLNIPSVSFYGPTDHQLIGATGLNQFHCVADKKRFACAPCYKKYCSFTQTKAPLAACMASFTPDAVWHQLQLLITRGESLQHH